MTNIDGKQYYSSGEFRKKIKESIVKNGKKLENDIKNEKEYIVNDKNIYV